MKMLGQVTKTTNPKVVFIGWAIWAVAVTTFAISVTYVAAYFIIKYW
jgi:hypothetical protein